MDQHLACPYCNQTVAVSGDLAGQMAQCPYCSSEFLVPGMPGPRPTPRPNPLTPRPGLSSGNAPSRSAARNAPAGNAASSSHGWIVPGLIGMTVMLVPIAAFAIYWTSKSSQPVAAAPAAEVEAEPQAATDEDAGADYANDDAGSGGTTLEGVVLSGSFTPPSGNEPASSPPAVAPAQNLAQPAAQNSSNGPPAANMPPQPSAPLVASSTPAVSSLAPAVAASTPAPPPATSSADDPFASERSPVKSTREVVQAVEPSVAVIKVPGVGLGSGFVVDSQGIIVTNFHVIAGAKTAQAEFLNENITLDIQGFLVVAPGKDLAILKVDPAGHSLRPLPLAPSRPDKGEGVLAFGAPKGFGGSVSDGIISAIRTGSDIRDQLLGETKHDVYTDVLGYDQDAVWLQTSTPISPGNSGGPLVNLRGEVVGLNTWNRSDGQNLNFAISAEHVRQAMLSSQSGLRPLADLPKPRKDPDELARGDGKKTLEYWKQIGEINRTMYDKLKKLPRPALPKTYNKRRNFAVRLSNFYAKWAEVLPDAAARLKDLDVKGVDPELVLLVTADAMIMEGKAEDLRALALAAEAGKLVVFDTESIMRKSYGSRDGTVAQAYDILRLKFNLQYGMTFPNIAGDAPRDRSSGQSPSASSSDDDDDEDDDSGPRAKAEDPEVVAERNLKLAKQMLKNAITRDAGREKLEKIITEYPNTKAAEEAKTLLREMGVK